MPDPLLKTVSASQAAALFNASPYQTRWMLWQRFAHGLADDVPETVRMKWGKLLEPLILEQVAADWKLEVIPNKDYVRRGLLGATRDARIIAPDKGPGTVEVKCVFDYEVWARDWQGGRFVPRNHEIQLQTQMKVGDGDGIGMVGDAPRDGIRQTDGRVSWGSYNWGLIVAWVCADLYYYERAPILPLWHRLDIEAGRFFRSVEERNEPDPFGASIEIPWLTEMFPTRPDAVLDLSDQWQYVATAEDARQYAFHKEERAGHDRAGNELRAKLLGLAKENGRVLLPCGYSYRVRASGKGKTIDVHIPDVPLQPPPVPESVLHAG